MKKIILLVLAFLFLGACSVFRTKVPSYPSGVFFPLAKDGEIVYSGRIIDRIERERDRLYLTTRNGKVYCFDGVKRRVLWETKVSENLISPPSIGVENIYVCDRNSTLYCLNKKGDLLWKIDVEEGITSGISELHAAVCFGTEKGNFYAFDSTNGRELWRFHAEAAIHSTPILADNKIVFGCDDHNLYILSWEGALIGTIRVAGRIQGPPLVEKNLVYFGADDHYFYCFSLQKKKKKWKIKTGGNIVTSPVFAGKRVLFLCWNNVVYCLHKKKGHILWWQMIPSRSFYQLEVSGDRVVVSSLSSLLLSFDLETGEKVGELDAKQEIKSNPVWFDPYLLFSLYDSQKDRGSILFLKKRVRVSLKPSKQSPQQVGEEIRFNASVIGFFMPKYEFYLKEGEEEVVVQESSETNFWVWFPEKTGDYIVGVRVFDGKENASSEIPFSVKETQKL